MTNWLAALHQGEVFGLPYRIFVCVFGLIVAMLSVTGVTLWFMKRRSRWMRIDKADVVRHRSLTRAS